MGKKASKTKSLGETVDNWVIVLTTLFKIFGPSSIAIIALSLFIFWYADDSQKRAIIDNWILLRNETHPYCVMIITVLFLSLILFIFYHSMTIRFMDKKLKKS